MLKNFVIIFFFNYFFFQIDLSEIKKKTKLQEPKKHADLYLCFNVVGVWKYENRAFHS